MSAFERLIKFRAKDDGKVYFANVGVGLQIAAGLGVTAFQSLADLESNSRSQEATLLAPVPHENVPIYCVGLNYRSHATEAKLSTPSYPPLWTKPATALANPNEDIGVNQFCASSLPDYEGELVFVTSRECKNISVKDAPSYILGYTVGNDLSCRFFQLPKNSGGQFFFAKAFDKFAPIGPVLVSPEQYEVAAKGRKLTTRVNGSVVQNVEIAKDMIFSPAQILSHMSQGTTIPAGTAVMTGTPAGVGAFRSPKSFLKDGDVVEVEIGGIGVLKNTMRFQGGGSARI
ncbi:hypothetical protein LTR84_007078 [Exophiala bonariae]|uniref:Fumarylacetoacetase-like C-terminal domain-containing protein n=1 Tax=Exophiala bonariae TaxID=1690606 RepID=A0AAV9MZI4_9EURO|nr:hypothetical protein LTR84_007078 [Exophiala bonariae]